MEQGNLKVLVIRRGALGDVIQVAACFDQVRVQRPEVEIHVLTDRSCFPLLERMGSVSKLHEWPRDTDPIGYSATLTAARTIKTEKVDLIINLMPAVKSKLIAWYCKVPSEVLKKKRFTERGSVLRNMQTSHVAHEYFETFQRALGLFPLGRESLVPVIQADPNKGSTCANRMAIGLVLGVAPKRQNKAWPIERFLKLSKMLLQEFDCEVILIGGKRECELARSFPSDERIQNRIGLELSESIAEMQKCSIVVGADTGPTHIATALGVPVVMCFGPTSASRTGPLGTGTVIRPPEEMLCWPCERRKCPLRGDAFQQCMRSISVSDVFEACRTILGG